MTSLTHLQAVYPNLAGLLEEVGPIAQPQPKEEPVAESITNIVVGQMLSRKAAESIYGRAVVARDRAGLSGCWQLPSSALSAAGLSARKVRTIKEFGTYYETKTSEVEAWRTLEYEKLVEEVNHHWGLSRWSADMLAIFYFALPDVFPETDGTIQRVLRDLKHSNFDFSEDDVPNAQPYRSHLALYLWAMLDRKLLDSASAL